MDSVNLKICNSAMDFEEYEGSFGNLIIYAKITGYILFASLSITYNTVVS